MIQAKSLYLSIIASGCLLTSCTEPNPEPTTAPAPETPIPQTTTSGVVHFEGIPDTGITAKEAILLSSLDSETRTLLERQRQLFEYTITGVNPEQEAMNGSLSSDDETALDQTMAKLKQAYPEQIIVNTQLNQEGVDDDRLRKIPSDHELYEKYRTLFSAINWDNLPRALKFINQAINQDSKKISEGLQSTDAYATQKAKITLQWLGQLETHLKDYLSLANARIDAQNRFAREKAAPKAKTWEEFLAMHSTQIIINVSKNIVGSTLINEDGSFTVEGEGTLIVRIEYGSLSAYFIPDDTSETRVRVSD